MGGEESCPMPVLGSSSKNYFYFSDSMSEFPKFRGWKKIRLPPNRVCNIDELWVVYLGL